MISFYADTQSLVIGKNKVKFDFPIYQLAFYRDVFFVLFHPGSDGKNWGQFHNLCGVNVEGKVMWKAELPDSSAGCFDRITLEDEKLHAYASTYDCIIDPATGKIMSSEFYK
jgi:hypothetical protein